MFAGIIIQVADKVEATPAIGLHHGTDAAAGFASPDDEEPPFRSGAAPDVEEEPEQETPEDDKGDIDDDKGGEQPAGEFSEAEVQNTGTNEGRQDVGDDDGLEFVGDFVDSFGVVDGSEQEGECPDGGYDEVEGLGEVNLVNGDEVRELGEERPYGHGNVEGEEGQTGV